MNPTRVLIIKHGYSDSCDHHIIPGVDLAAVMRSSCLLEDMKGCEVTWITSPAAGFLFWQNHLIDNLILASSPEELPLSFYGEGFDVLVNLEKQRDWCEFAGQMRANRKYGFEDWTATGSEAYFGASAEHIKRLELDGQRRVRQQRLFATVGREWYGQRYVLGYRPRVARLFDVGLVDMTGATGWPAERMQALQEELGRDYLVSRQPGRENGRSFIDWIAACGMIVSGDGLGLVLALALGKPVAALLKPAEVEQVYLYGQGIKVTPACERECMSCPGTRCHYETSCLAQIPVGETAEAVRQLAGERTAGRSMLVTAAAEERG